MAQTMPDLRSATATASDTSGRQARTSKSRLLYDNRSTKQPTRIQTVLEYVREGIATGRLKPGSKLPVENEIAEHLGVSRTPVREAVKILEAVGILDVRIGSGTYVQPSLEPSIAQLLMFQLYLRQTTPKKLMEARRIIERGCAELAAERRKPADLDEMADSIKALEFFAGAEHEQPDETLEADLAFHRAVYKATDNELINAIGNFVLDLVSPWVRQSLQLTGAAKAAEMHRAELMMIEAQNAGAARECVAAVDLGMQHWLESLQTLGADNDEK